MNTTNDADDEADNDDEKAKKKVWHWRKKLPPQANKNFLDQEFSAPSKNFEEMALVIALECFRNLN